MRSAKEAHTRATHSPVYATRVCCARAHFTTVCRWHGAAYKYARAEKRKENTKARVVQREEEKREGQPDTTRAHKRCEAL